MSSNPRVRRLKARAARLKARVRRLKARAEAWKPRVKRKDSEFKNIEFHDFTVLNETILATKQEFFFTKLAPVQSITGIVLLGFSLILLPGMFISYYTIIYFFVNNFFFEYLYFSEYDIWMILFVFWLRNRPSIKYVGS